MISPMRASVLFLSLFSSLVLASSNSTSGYEPRTLMRRVDPQFPDSPPSCPICAQNYASINSCAQASTVLANITMSLFNPGEFVDVIKCACTDTFQSTFPQCVDCFIQTNQTDVLNTPDLPSLVNNIRTVCAFASTVLSNKTTSSAIPGATQTSSARSLKWDCQWLIGGLFILPLRTILT